MRKSIFALTLLASLWTVILGEKFLQIDRYGSDLPCWDQWDAEGNNLLRPYVEHTLTAADFFRPHNEHRIFFTRLLTLGLFAANDRQWDCRLELVVNAFLHTAVALLLVALALRMLPPWPAVGFAAVAALFFGMSVSWENTLAGFQSQFYFLLLFSVLYFGGTFLARPRTWAWWLAPLAGAAALLSLASGMLSAAAILATVGLRALRDRKFTRDDGWILAAGSVLLVAGWFMKVEVPGHAHLKTAGFGAWVATALLQFSWPVRTFWAAPLGVIPPLALGLAFLRRRIDGPIALSLLAASGWLCLQIAGIAYARGGGDNGFAPRYADINALNVLVNLLVLGYLALQAQSARSRRWLCAGAAAFTGLALWGLSRETKQIYEGTLLQMPKINAARVETVRSYLTSRDPSFYAKAPWDELPYPSATILAHILDEPAVRAMLPDSIQPKIVLAADPLATHGFGTYEARSAVLHTPLALAAWQSPSSASPATTARFLSREFAVDHARAGLFVAGTAAAGDVQLRLIDRQDRAYPPLADLGSPGPRWVRINFSVPAGAYRLEVTQARPNGWFAFTQPITETNLSHLARKAAGLGTWLLGCGWALGGVAILLLAKRDVSQPPCTASVR